MYIVHISEPHPISGLSLRQIIGHVSHRIQIIGHVRCVEEASHCHGDKRVVAAVAVERHVPQRARGWFSPVSNNHGRIHINTVQAICDPDSAVFTCTHGVSGLPVGNRCDRKRHASVTSGEPNLIALSLELYIRSLCTTELQSPSTYERGVLGGGQEVRKVITRLRRALSVTRGKTCTAAMTRLPYCQLNITHTMLLSV